jgi:hypothetical protein
MGAIHFPFVLVVDLEYYFLELSAVLLAVLIEFLHTCLFQFAGSSFFICEPPVLGCFSLASIKVHSRAVFSSSLADSGCDFPVHLGLPFGLLIPLWHRVTTHVFLQAKALRAPSLFSGIRFKSPFFVQGHGPPRHFLYPFGPLLDFLSE